MTLYRWHQWDIYKTYSCTDVSTCSVDTLLFFIFIHSLIIWKDTLNHLRGVLYLFDTPIPPIYDAGYINITCSHYNMFSSHTGIYNSLKYTFFFNYKKLIISLSLDTAKCASVYTLGMKFNIIMKLNYIHIYILRFQTFELKFIERNYVI